MAFPFLFRVMSLGGLAARVRLPSSLAWLVVGKVSLVAIPSTPLCLLDPLSLTGAVAMLPLMEEVCLVEVATAVSSTELAFTMPGPGWTTTSEVRLCSRSWLDESLVTPVMVATAVSSMELAHYDRV